MEKKKMCFFNGKIKCYNVCCIIFKCVIYHNHWNGANTHTKALFKDRVFLSRGQDEATSWVPLDILLISTAENFGSFHYYYILLSLCLQAFQVKGTIFKKLNFKSSCIKSCSLPWIYFKMEYRSYHINLPNWNELKGKGIFEKGRPRINKSDQRGQGPHRFNPTAFASSQTGPISGFINPFHLFIHSFTQQTFTNCLLCVEH